MHLSAPDSETNMKPGTKINSLLLSGMCALKLPAGGAKRQRDGCPCQDRLPIPPECFTEADQLRAPQGCPA